MWEGQYWKSPIGQLGVSNKCRVVKSSPRSPYGPFHHRTKRIVGQSGFMFRSYRTTNREREREREKERSRKAPNTINIKNIEKRGTYA